MSLVWCATSVAVIQQNACIHVGSVHAPPQDMCQIVFLVLRLGTHLMEGTSHLAEETGKLDNEEYVKKLAALAKRDNQKGLV